MSPLDLSHFRDVLGDIVGSVIADVQDRDWAVQSVMEAAEEIAEPPHLRDLQARFDDMSARLTRIDEIHRRASDDGKCVACETPHPCDTARQATVAF